MIYSREKINVFQVFTMIIALTIGAGIIYLPSDLSKEVAGDGIFTILFGTIIFIFLSYMISKIIINYQNKSFLEMTSNIYNKPIAYIFMIILIQHFLFLSMFNVRVFAQTMNMYMLYNSPSSVIILTILLLSAYGARGGIESIARLSQLLIIVVLLSVLFLTMCTNGIGDYTNVFPIFQSNIGQMTRSLDLIVASFSGLEFILIIGFFIKKSEKLFKCTYIAIIIVGISYLMLFCSCMAVFGQKGTQNLLAPVLTLVKTINIEGNFIENIDVLVMGAWVVNMFLTISIAIYVLMLLIGEILDLKEYNYLSLPISGIIYILTLYINNNFYLMKLENSIYLKICEYIAILGIPILLYVGCVLKKKVRKNEV